MFPADNGAYGASEIVPAAILFSSDMCAFGAKNRKFYDDAAWFPDSVSVIPTKPFKKTIKTYYGILNCVIGCTVSFSVRYFVRRLLFTEGGRRRVNKSSYCWLFG